MPGKIRPGMYTTRCPRRVPRKAPAKAEEAELEDSSSEETPKRKYPDRSRARWNCVEHAIQQLRVGEEGIRTRSDLFREIHKKILPLLRIYDEEDDEDLVMRMYSAFCGRLTDAEQVRFHEKMLSVYPTLAALSSPEFRPQTFRYARGTINPGIKPRPFPTTAQEVATFATALVERATAREFREGPGADSHYRDGGWDPTLSRVRCPVCTGIGFLGQGYYVYPSHPPHVSVLI